MLASGDPRAETLLQDISQVKLSVTLPFLRIFTWFQDPLAREIINRIDNSPYGAKGRGGDPSGAKTRHNDSVSSDLVSTQ